jgi:hypothetical protein
MVRLPEFQVTLDVQDLRKYFSGRRAVALSIFKMQAVTTWLTDNSTKLLSRDLQTASKVSTAIDT